VPTLSEDFAPPALRLTVSQPADCGAQVTEGGERIAGVALGLAL
jgi:hypothetical protein